MRALRVVFDSNVIISGFLIGGPPARLLKHALRESVQSYTSLSILDEVRDVLQRPKFGLSSDQAAGCNVELIMKDISTVRSDPSRLERWGQIAMAEANSRAL